MTHLAEGAVRRFLDEPAAVSDADQGHLTGCPRCREILAQARDDRDLAARALGADAVPDAAADAVPDAAVDLDRAWTALRRRLEEDSSGAPRAMTDPEVLMAAAGRRRPRLVEQVVRRPLVAAVVAGTVVLGGGAAAAATDWLPIFRTTKVTPVQVSPQDLTGVEQLTGHLDRLAELSAFGEVVAPDQVQPGVVPDAATATARTGLAVPEVANLPTGVEGSPTYLVVGRQTVQFTFSAAKATRWARANGTVLPPMPAGLDGSRLRIEGGPGVAVVWGQRTGIPTLVVARAMAPTAVTQGASLPVIRDYLLSMSRISPELAAQLRSVTGDGTTLPIPVLTGVATSSQTDIGGAPATVVESNNQLGTAVIWVDDGELDLVLGLLSTNETLAVARGLR